MEIIWEYNKTNNKLKSYISVSFYLNASFQSCCIVKRGMFCKLSESSMLSAILKFLSEFRAKVRQNKSIIGRGGTVWKLKQANIFNSYFYIPPIIIFIVKFKVNKIFQSIRIRDKWLVWLQDFAHPSPESMLPCQKTNACFCSHDCQQPRSGGRVLEFVLIKHQITYFTTQNSAFETVC